jgi:hypothetical protein
LFLEATRHKSLLEDAKTHLHAGRADLAVILGETAFEVLSTQILDDLARRRNLQWLVHQDVLGSTVDLASSDRQRKIYEGLAGERLQDHPDWSRYKALVKLRHRAVHAGRMPAITEATAFLEIVERLMRSLEEVRGRS